MLAVWREHNLADRDFDAVLGLAGRWFAAPASDDKLAGVLPMAERLAHALTLSHVDDLAAPLVAGHDADRNVVDWYSTKALHAFLLAVPS